MKKELKGAVAGFLTGAMLIGGAAFAETTSKNIEIFYRNIRLFVDGGEITPTDANGKYVEPFIYDGTTYLPVRAVANAFDKDVIWDGETSTIYIGKQDVNQPDAYLHTMQYNDYKEGNVDYWFKVINGTITDVNGEVYKDGLLFCIPVYKYGSIKDDADAANIKVAYPLNSQYSRLKGKIVLPKEYDSTTGKNDDCGTSETNVFIYGDDKLLFRGVGITNSLPFEFDINTNGINQLVIKVSSVYSNSHVALTDLALYK